jgi:hypothetical protein
MCNCTGVQVYSNCAGNPDCNCDKGFNNMIGMNGFSNATGEIQTLATPTIQVQTTIPTIKLPTTTAPTTSSTTNTSGTTFNKVLDFGSSVLGLFGKSSSSASSTPVVIPTEEKKIPTAVWVVVGGLLLLVVAFVIVKAEPKK